MPTYEYACSACGHQFEQFQSIMAKPTLKCPKCGKKKVKRLISGGAGFIFKGSGFYETDYRSESYKAGAKNDAPKTETPKTDTKTDTKPAATPAKSESTPAAPAAASKTKAK